MRYVSCLSLICLLLAFFYIPAASEGADQSSATQKTRLADDVNDFAIDIYKQLTLKGGNIFFSPFSISSAMAIAYAGARENTAAEIERTLHFSNSKTEIHSSMKLLRDEFSSIPGEEGTFGVSNQIWLERQEEIIASYSELIDNNYGAIVQPTDFLNDYEKARLEINNWVAENTRERIKDALKPGELNFITRFVLANTAFFDSNWLEPFDRSATIEELFRTEKEKQRSVLMMRRTGNYYYGENEDMQWIKIPYKIQGFSLLIFLPRENESFTQLKILEDKLTSKAINSWITDMQEINLTLSIPKFKDSCRFNLLEVLQKRGIELAFDWSKADFSGMVHDPKRNEYSLCISEIIHQAFIEIDEDKTGATEPATTAALTEPNIESKALTEFRANRPFVYCLTNDSSTVLFMGRITDPK